MSVPPRAMPMATALVEAAGPPASFDFTGAPRWSVVVLSDGTPAARVELPSPGAAGPRFVGAALARRADGLAFRQRLRADLRRRLGAPPDDAPDEPPSVSVILCTHRRPHYLGDVLGALAALDPAPDEIVVVDNDPGADDCRAEVEAAGFRYVREDRRGLDNARNAGVRAARGDVLVFTDDDCVPPPGWLRSIPVTFADPAVGAASGPALPWRLDTPSRVRMERQAALSRGLDRMVFDFHIISVVHAGGVGFGANMAFRRSALLELGAEPFPPELDAGTPTESGGDYYVLARTVVGGHRVVYEPDMYTFHQHRPDPRSVHRAIRGYGIGCSAAMSKMVVEHRELEGWRGWWWFLAQYLRTQRRRLVGRSDRVETRLSCEFIVGAVLGPLRWRRSLAQQRAISGRSVSRAMEPAAGHPPVPAAQPPQDDDSSPRLSVVVPTHRRPEALARCLDRLAAQTVAGGDFEVVVIDDAQPPVLGADQVERPGLRVRLVASGGLGASKARNLGAELAQAPVVLFLDDDLVAEPQLLERHLARHAEADRPTAVVGPYPPAPPAPGLAARSTALWWSDTFTLMARSTAPTFMYGLSGNLSVPREAFLALGGFSDDIPYRREDWELGLRWLGAGHALVHAPEAVCRHEYTLTTASRLRGAELEGFGDAALVRAHPQTIGTLPVALHVPPEVGGALRRALFGAWRRGSARRVVNGVLGVLEAGNLRGAWLRLMKRAQAASYHDGLRRAGWSGSPPADLLLRCELLDDAALAFDGPVPPTLQVTLGGRELARVRPDLGMWSSRIADQVVDAVAPIDLERLAAARGWAAAAAPADRHDVEVVRGATGSDPERFWRAVAVGAAASERALLAIPLASPTGEARRWLAEALDAFDAPGIDLAFGGALADDRPAQPLHVHDAAVPPSFGVGDAPAYLVVRTARLRELGGIPLEFVRHGHPAPSLALVRAVLDAGGLVGRRDVHGLAEPTVAPAEQGEAWAAVQLARAPVAPAALARAAAALVATVLWRTYKGGGRPDPGLLPAAFGAVRAAVRRLGR